MMYQLTHSTTYEYSAAISLSHHVLRLQPRLLPRQRLGTVDLQINPRPSVLKSHEDYFGNRVIYVTIEGPHKKLVMTSSGCVEILPPSNPPPETTPAWETVRETVMTGTGETLAAREFIFASPHIQKPGDFANYAVPSFTPARPVLEAVLDLTARMKDDFTFDPKATTIATPLEQVYKTRRGVCQDFAHFEIACLRAMGIPARYVSGYIETVPPPGKARLSGADASHAWVSFFCPGTGWIDVDPTNNILCSNHHITVAWGRDYSDVSPIRGVILGSGEHVLSVAVDVLPLPEGSLSDTTFTYER